MAARDPAQRCEARLTDEVIGPHALEPAPAEAILRSLPEWFGHECALIAYAQDASRLPTFAVLIDASPAATLSLRLHFAETAAINCIVVTRAHCGRGFGRAMLTAAEAWRRA